MTSSPPAKTSRYSTVVEVFRRKRNPTIEDFQFSDGLPTADDLPCSDDKPVDNELQILIPTLLYNILFDLWKDRADWLFSMDMGFYYDPQQPAIAPDGMLCLGIQEAPNENLRSSYVLWQEKVIPLLTLEIVSKTPGKERTKKKDIFESIGVLYYLVYAPLLKRKAKFQLYKLIEGEYILQSDGQTPYWMPEIGLAIGAERHLYGTKEREWLFWYDQNGVRYPSSIERAEAESQRAEIESQRAETEFKRAEIERKARIETERKNDVLRKRLSELGIDPDSI
jgi:Uma2 family endonuclease